MSSRLKHVASTCLAVAVLVGGCSSAAVDAVDDSEEPATTSTTTTVPAPPDTSAHEESSNSTSVEGVMNMSVTLSDRAQLTTIAFDALAFMTGDLCTDTFFPPGKVSDFFGFQYLRDNEPEAFGHNTAFAATVGENILYLLDGEQVAAMADLAAGQVGAVAEYGYARFPLMDAFRRLLEEDSSARGLSTEAVTEYSAEVYGLDGAISYARAELFADILAGLSSSQSDQLAALAAIDIADWPDRSQEPAIAAWRQQLDPTTHVTLMTLAGQLYSWYAGDVEADTYFCPERHGTYFGSFYMKDIPAMVSQQQGTDVTINENLTGQYGQLLLDLLDEQQREAIEDLVVSQQPLLDELVATRQAIATQLRLLLDAPEADRSSIEGAVAELSMRYGEIDGELVALYATVFDGVFETLTDVQVADLWAVRRDAQYLGLTEDPCSLSAGDLAYLYSEAIAMPAIGDSAQFFSLSD